ncbi:MAG TPA: 16S rRNA (guanine(966)-N(2))-methyltransferase RsmD [Allosphingosinicella sp.]|nr:16S rRNA (guanine(966)-N(2))-methyltransferase RsmD [Allosphingosinicella sp.]
MRIIAGEWRGRPLEAPTGSATRPTADRAREGLFSMLASRVGTFEGLHVADLFAGTGALGLEALSRGAAHCTFVENDRAAAAVLRQNLERLSALSRAEIRTQAVEYASPPARPCDIVLMDPPYATGLAALALARIGNPAWVAPAGLVSVETDGERLDPPAGFAVETERRFGKAHILLLRRES